MVSSLDLNPSRRLQDGAYGMRFHEPKKSTAKEATPADG
jgi:hypothetical protein